MKNNKAKDVKKTFRKLLKYNGKLIILVAIALVLSMTSSILAIIGPDKLKEITNIITDGLLTSINMYKIKKVGLLLISLYIMSFIFNYFNGYIMAIVTNKFAYNMRKDIVRKINVLPFSYYDKVSYGDILSRITNDVDTISMSLNQSLGTIVSATTMFLGSLFMMFKTNYILALTAIISTLVGFVFMAIIMAKSQKYFVKVQNDLGEINGHIEEVFSSHNVVKVYNASKEMTERFDKINDDLYSNSLKSQFFSGLMHPIMGFIGNLGYVTICVVGSILTIKGIISFGVIVAFLIYVRLFTRPLTQFAQAFTQLQSTMAASERVFNFLDEEELKEVTNRVTLKKKDVKGNIEFKDVKFGYDNSLIIKDFSAKVKAGSKVAIVGPTGAGKTTIVNLLMKFYDITSGDILIDGVSINKLTRENIHNLITMVLQDTWVFNGTVKDNIKYNQHKVSDKKINEVIDSVGLKHFVDTLPKGLDTVLDDYDSLSAGQKQLLTIARSMVVDTPFVILDEATSSVDTRTEKLVSSAMDKLSKNKTSFIIAHRLSTIKNADLILVMKNGNIIEQGTHKSLLNKNGFYAELYNSQFQE